MPVKYRLLEEKLEKQISRKAELEKEQSETELELTKLQAAYANGTITTDDLVNVQIKANTIEQTIASLTIMITETEREIVAAKYQTKKRESVLKILEVDKESIEDWKKFLSIYGNYEIFKPFLEMSACLQRIREKRHQYDIQVRSIIPNLSLYYGNPEVENELNKLITEIKAEGGDLGVLGSKIFGYLPTDPLYTENGVSLPENPLHFIVWDVVSKIAAFEVQKENHRLAVEAEKKTARAATGKD